MSDDWQTIRIRVRVVKLLDELCDANVARIPSKTSRTDMIEAALEAYRNLLRAVDTDRTAK